MEQEVALVAQVRITVMTVEMGLVEDDISTVIGSIAILAEELERWVVPSDRS